jgi:hypothetical protein
MALSIRDVLVLVNSRDEVVREQFTQASAAAYELLEA